VSGGFVAAAEGNEREKDSRFGGDGRSKKTEGKRR